MDSKVWHRKQSQYLWRALLSMWPGFESCRRRTKYELSLWLVLAGREDFLHLYPGVGEFPGVLIISMGTLNSGGKIKWSAPFRLGRFRKKNGLWFEWMQFFSLFSVSQPFNWFGCDIFCSGSFSPMVFFISPNNLTFLNSTSICNR